MFSSNKMLVEIEGENIYKDNGYDIKTVKNKKLYIIIENEEIFIKSLTLPCVDKKRLYELIKDELSYYLGELDKILFDYSIICKNKKSMELLIFYISLPNISFIKNSMEMAAIKKINLIQFIYLNCYKGFLTKKDFYFIFKYKSVIYILLVINGFLRGNTKVNIDYLKNNTFDKIFVNLKNKYRQMDIEIESIYLTNECKSFKDYIPEMFECKLIDNFEESKIIKSVFRG